MLFNSLGYAIFLPIVFLLFYQLPKQQHRIIFLTLASYFFYMCWNPIYIVLILASTVLDFFVGKQMAKEEDESKQRWLLSLSLLGNLGILFYFKYYNFLGENIQLIFEYFNIAFQYPEHHYLLPVGISFYTFQTLSYTLDIYNEEMEAEENFFVFALYVSFFPQLVAGPIERATSLLPQLRAKYDLKYEKAVEGFRLILLGFFKKVVVADRLAFYVDTIFENPEAYNGYSVMLGCVFFTFQIYCDFSGYSDIAIGTARLFGIDLMENFKGPLLSRSVTEFWRRWHISMSTWFRDYLYTPIAFSMRRMGKYNFVLPILISFTVIGVWHGANWTYIIFGFLHALVLLYEAFTRELRMKADAFFNTYLYNGISIFLTFTFYAFTCMIFRAESMTHAMEITNAMFQFEQPVVTEVLTKDSELFDITLSVYLSVFIMLIHIVEYNEGILQFFKEKSKLVRWGIYYILIALIFSIGVFNSYQEFIYFQF